MPLPSGPDFLVSLVSGGGTVDTELPTAAALSDAIGNPTSPMVGAAGMLWNPTASAWQRARASHGITGLASAARTATTSTADITSYNLKAATVTLTVTSPTSATGAGVQVLFQSKDPVTGSYKRMNTDPAIVNDDGTYVYQMGPGASWTGQLNQTTSMYLPDTWRVSVIHTDGTSYTYSLGISLSF